MAACFNVGEVLDEIFEETSGEDGKDCSSEALKNCTVSAKPNLGTGSLLCTKKSCFGREVEAKRFLRTYPIHPSSLFKEECMLWLKGIYRRLGGKRRVRSPYYGELNRDIPFGLFDILVRVISILGISKPLCFVESNRKATVISFTSMELLLKFMSLLADISDTEVQTRFFKRDLKGKKKGHKVAVLVEDTKDFAFVYKFKKGQMTLCFNFGEWNAYNFPQHN